MKPQKETFPSTVSGKAAAASDAFVRETVPMEDVGQATSAIRARLRPASSEGCARTNECPRPSSKTSGAMRRQASQSMQVRST